MAVLIIILSVLLSSCTQAPANDARVWIVSAGLDYRNTDVPVLNGTVEDAAEIAMCLTSIYESKGIESSVCLMTDYGGEPDTDNPLYPTAGNIVSCLMSIKPGPQDLLVFYWSGHGAVDRYGLFLAAAPTEGLAYTKLYAEDLAAVVQSMKCSAVLILDACYSGSFPMQDSGLAVIASCRADETAMMTHVRTRDGIVEGHSLFTAALLECLGWEHSTEYQRFLGSLPVYGMLAHVPGRKSVQELACEVRKKIPQEVQVPVFDRTDVPVLLIP